MSEVPGPNPDEVMQRAKDAAMSRLGETESVDPASLAAAKKAEIEQHEAEEALRMEAEARKAQEERAELERRGEEMLPTEEEIKARQAEQEAKRDRMAEMNEWANVTGAVAEGKAKKAAENEDSFKAGVKGAKSVVSVEHAEQLYNRKNQDISVEDVITSNVPGTDYEYARNFKGFHNVVDEKGTTSTQVNGQDEFSRSPKHIRDDTLPHGTHDNPERPTFR